MIRWTDRNSKVATPQTQFAYLDVSASGTTVVVPADAGGRKIRVTRYSLTAQGTVQVKFTSSGGSQISGTKYLQAGVSCEGQHSDAGHFETLPGEGLSVVLGSAVGIGVDLTISYESDTTNSVRK